MGYQFGMFLFYFCLGNVFLISKSHCCTGLFGTTKTCILTDGWMNVSVRIYFLCCYFPKPTTYITLINFDPSIRLFKVSLVKKWKNNNIHFVQKFRTRRVNFSKKLSRFLLYFDRIWWLLFFEHTFANFSRPTWYFFFDWSDAPYNKF